MIVFVSLILWNSNTISNMDDIKDHEDEEVFCCSALLLTLKKFLITFTFLLSRSWKICCLDYFLFSHIYFAEHLLSKHQSLDSRENLTCKLRSHFFERNFCHLSHCFSTVFFNLSLVKVAKLAPTFTTLILVIKVPEIFFRGIRIYMHKCDCHYCFLENKYGCSPINKIIKVVLA